jgi:hypothetical protein
MLTQESGRGRSAATRKVRMPYSASDEYFIHQLPRPLDEVHDTERSWSDRCYFNAHSPDGTILLANGYGNNPNTQSAMGYAKVGLADGRHWDFSANRECKSDRAEMYAGAMRWTCVEPLKLWKMELGPNPTGIEWELNYRARTPMWELLPIQIRKNGRTIADQYHIKQSGTYTGWVLIDGERISVDGFGGGRDRTIGVRVADQIDFWVWFSANFEDRSVEAWVFESADGTVQYVDGGVTFVDGRLSKRFVKFEHNITFDGDLKRPTKADIVFTDQDGKTLELAAQAPHQEVNVYHGRPLPTRQVADDGTGYFAWNGNNRDELRQLEGLSVSMDQLMRYEMNGMTGHGVFEILALGEGYTRYPNWGPMDASLFRQ